MDITYGTALADSQLSSDTASWTVGTSTTVAGTFTYASEGSVFSGGSGQSETVTFTPTDSTDYATATGTVTVNVTPATPNVVAQPGGHHLRHGPGRQRSSAAHGKLDRGRDLDHSGRHRSPTPAAGTS